MTELLLTGFFGGVIGWLIRDFMAAKFEREAVTDMKELRDIVERTRYKPERFAEMEEIGHAIRARRETYNDWRRPK